MATAYHEAGHAVANIVLGFEVTHCTIVPKDDTVGHVEHPHPIWKYGLSVRRERTAWGRRAIVTCYAGLAAEHHFCGTPFSFDDGVRHRAWADHAEASELLCKFVHVRGGAVVDVDAFHAALQPFQHEALQLVRQQRTAIERLAQRLLSQPTLTEDEVLAAMERR
jgi:ATP-dependent Zn protease